MRQNPTIPLARVISELTKAGIVTANTDRTTLYALIKVYRCWKVAANFAMKHDKLVTYLNDPTVREKLAQDCSDLSSLMNVCELIFLSTNPHQQRCDLDGVVLLEWEKRVADRLLKIAKLPTVKDDRRRYNRYHFGKFTTYLVETFKLTGQFRLTVMDFSLGKIGKATEDDWNGNDLNWYWQQELIEKTIVQCVEQYKHKNNPQATVNL